MIPNWHIRIDRIAYWDKFGRPDIIPRQGTSISYWWIDPAKERALAERKAREPQVSETSDSGTLGTVALYGAIGLLLLFGYLSVRRLGGRAAG